VKFDAGTDSGSAVYSFVSNRLPVWGDIYIKGGAGNWLANEGLGDLDGEDVMQYVARPNGAIPEPAMLWIVALGLGLLSRRR
jgi:hypothetical protein